MAIRRVLVTGARGFVGRYLVTALQESGAEVSGLDVAGADGALDPDWLVHRTTLGSGDPEAADRLADLLVAESCEAVYHLAGQSSAGASFGDPAGTVRANLLGTLEVLEALRLIKKRGHEPPRLLAVGSAEEYGTAARADRPCRENDPIQPASPYAVSKAAATQLTRMYHQSFGLPVMVVRAFNHTGPGQDARFVFPSFAAQIAAIEAGRDEPVLRTGDLSPARDFLDVRDVVAAYLALMDRGEHGRIYNVCSGSTLTIGDGLEILLGLSGAAIEVAPDPSRMRPAEIPRLVGDPSRLRKTTGWQPVHAFKDTLRDLLEAARRQLI